MTKPNHFIAGTIAVSFAVVSLLVCVAAEARDLAASDKFMFQSGSQSLPISLRAPLLIFDDDVKVGNALPLKVQDGAEGSGEIMVEYAPTLLDDGGSLEIHLHLRENAEESTLRKWATFRVSGSTKTHLLKEVVLEDLDAKGMITRAFPGEIQSYPIFVNSFFLGVEFPIASTRLEESRVIVAHAPGLRVEPDKEYSTRTAVFGAASDGNVARAFRNYVAAHRPLPNGLHVNYNSWWTAPSPYYKEKDILDLMETFRASLYEPFQCSFDSFCIDMGWSNMKSLWRIDEKLFPEGFSRVQAAAAAMNSHLGVWISPSAMYSTALDVNWARDNGYEAMKDAMCLGGPRYAAAFRDCVVDMASKFGVRHFKIDGYRITCPETNHGHEPGPLSAEPIAEGIIAAADAIHAAAPEAWLEPTCFGLNPSPWWLFHFNSVIGSYGDDAPHGRVPAPVNRESYTTGRDFFNMQGACWNPAPQAAQEVLGIIHQTKDPFMNDAVMTVMRGHMFLPVYLNPKYMDSARWRSFAHLILWARLNAPALSDTIPLPPASWRGGLCPKFSLTDPMPREPYGYAHQSSDRLLVVLRNPWILPQTYDLSLASEVESSPDAKPLQVVSLYPERRVYARDAKPNGVLPVHLAPYETVVLSVSPEEELEGAPDAESVWKDKIQIEGLRKSIVKTEYDGPSGALGSDWTSLVGDAAYSFDLSLSADVTVNSSEAEFLILYDGDATPTPPNAKLLVNGSEVPLDMVSSETEWCATVQDRVEHWKFLKAPLPAGHAAILASISNPGQGILISAWIWARKPSHDEEGSLEALNLLPSPETISLDAKPLQPPVDLSKEPINSTVRAPRPVDRISGVYLDSLKPVSNEQGCCELQRNLSVLGRPISIAGKIYRRGLGTHAPAKTVFALDEKARRFKAYVGADDETMPTVSFEVWVDGQKRWDSGLMKQGDVAKEVDVDVAGGKSLELIVTNGGDEIITDHADWAEARLTF